MDPYIKKIYDHIDKTLLLILQNLKEKVTVIRFGAIGYRDFEKGSKTSSQVEIIPLTEHSHLA